MLDQFDRLRKRNAFLEQYKKEKMFESGLEEFDDARRAPPPFTFLLATADLTDVRVPGRPPRSC